MTPVEAARLKDARVTRVTLASLIAKGVFGADADPAKVRFSVRVARTGELFVTEISYGKEGYFREDAVYNASPALAWLFLLCEEWLAQSAYTPEIGLLPGLTRRLADYPGNVRPPDATRQENA